MQIDTNTISFLKEKASFVRRETIKLHGLSPETRVASSLSDIEIFVCLYYGKILNFDPQNKDWDQRDRFILSKGHGGISLYPILGDLGFYNIKDIETISKKHSLFGSIPDCAIPGFETINGSLGHGLGVASGIAMALKAKKRSSSVFVLMGDGEFYEGSVWEAVMFAAHNKLDNLTLIIDNNKISMLDYCKNVLNIEPFCDKFNVFGWDTVEVSGHSIEEVYSSLSSLKQRSHGKPKVCIAHTLKGKGIKELENDSLCHIRSLSPEQVNEILKESL